MSLREESITLSTSNEDFLIREIILTHDPDDHHHLDSEMLLDLVENTLRYTTDDVIVQSNRTVLAKTPVFDPIETSSIDLTESSEEPISRIIYTMSNEIHCQCFKDQNLHTKTLALLETLSHYRWDAKVVVALASFAHSYALFWLVTNLQPGDPLAFSLAIVRQLPKSTRMLLKPKFKAMKLLVRTMLKLTKSIIRFEGIPLQHELVDDVAKSRIYVATYWMFRSILVCSSHIADFRNLSIDQQVSPDRTVVAAWGLHSLGNKLNSLNQDLEHYFENCQEQIETKLCENLQHMFKGKQSDNQKALGTLFASQNVPFRNPYSRDKIDVQKLKSKTVLLLITKPDLLPMDKIFFLVQQTQTDQDSSVIIWVPIPSTNEWSSADRTSFEFFSNRLPWLSVRKPWLLNSSVVSYIRQEWSFEHDPVVVVLDENGVVTNRNAMDMVWIWGSKAFPFSSTREKELWEEANWTVELIVNGISPLLSEWVKEGKNLCIYGSNNLDWIKEFTKTINKLKTIANIHDLEVIYVGSKNPRHENLKNILNTINQENLSTSLSLNNVHLFWFCLEAIKRSVDQHNQTIAARVTELLELNGRDGWAMIGGGSSTVVIDQEKLRECIGWFSLWQESVQEMGVVGAIRAAIEACVNGGKCQHDEVVPYEEGFIEKRLICGSCKRPIEKFVLFKCDE